MIRARHFDKPDFDVALRLIEVALPVELPKRDPSEPLFIYGTGKLGRLAADFLSFVGEPVAGWFDSASGLHPPPSAQIAVAISKYPFAEIADRLRRQGLKDVFPFYDLAESLWCIQHPLQNGWIASKPDSESIVYMYEVFAEFADDISRAHYLQFIAWRTIREEWTFAQSPVTVDDQHIIPEIVSVLYDNERLIDGGAYRGEFGRRFKTVTAFEPDPFNTRNPTPALSDRDGEANFYSGFGFCSRLGPCGNVSVQTRRIDSYDLDPTFIKLHLEGGELPALKGAITTITRCRPIIAANVDHNDDGIWRTILWLKDNLEDYRFLFRNHAWLASGSVVYAIPNERGLR